MYYNLSPLKDPLYTDSYRTDQTSLFVSQPLTLIPIFDTKNFRLSLFFCFSTATCFSSFFIFILTLLCSLSLPFSFFSLFHCAALKGSFPIYGQYGRSDVSCVFVNNSCMFALFTVLFVCFFVFHCG